MIYKGVVFNEMKGPYSSPEARAVSRTSQETLYTDHALWVSSGGDPAAILDLTYKPVQRFSRYVLSPVECADLVVWR